MSEPKFKTTLTQWLLFTNDRVEFLNHFPDGNFNCCIIGYKVLPVNDCKNNFFISGEQQVIENGFFFPVGLPGSPFDQVSGDSQLNALF